MLGPVLRSFLRENEAEGVGLNFSIDRCSDDRSDSTWIYVGSKSKILVQFKDLFLY